MIAVQPIDVSKGGMMLLNNAFALLPMSALLYYFGEHHKWAKLREITSMDWSLLPGPTQCPTPSVCTQHSMSLTAEHCVCYRSTLLLVY